MDLKVLANELQKELESSCSSVELMGEVDDDGTAWFFTIGEDTTGFVSCDSNAEDTEVPTVTIVIKLCDATDLSKEDLLRLMDTGGEMFRTTLTAKEIDGTWMLFAQYKVMAKHFEPNEFLGCIEHLQEQIDLFCGLPRN